MDIRLDVTPTGDYAMANVTVNETVEDNDTWNYMEDDSPVSPGSFNVMKQPLFVAIVVTLYTIVIVLGALGNILVVVTIAKTKQLWNATNIFIANLAITDIFVCVFDLPLSAYYQLTDDWVFGKVLCHVIPSAFAVVVYASTLSLTMIAVDRFILIVFPLKNRMSITVAILLAVVICIVSTAVASPIAIYAVYQEVIYPDIKIFWRFCIETWPDVKHRRLYTILTLVLQYIVPLIVIAILYSCIFRKVRERMRNTRGGQSCRKTKTTKMLVAVVAIFAITWTPFQVFSIITEFSPDLVRGTYYKFVDSMLRVLAMSSSCINPILYGWLNDNYRKAFLSIIKRPTSAPKNVKREDSEITKQTTKSANLGKFRVSPSKDCKYHVNGRDRAPETPVEPEAVPLQAINNNGLDTGDGPEERGSPQLSDDCKLIA